MEYSQILGAVSEDTEKPRIIREDPAPSQLPPSSLQQRGLSQVQAMSWDERKGRGPGLGKVKARDSKWRQLDWKVLKKRSEGRGHLRH